MSEPTDISEHVRDYDNVGNAADFRPFPFQLGGERRKVPYPLASTKRAVQTAFAENRVEDVYRLAFGAQWPAVSAALDDLEERGDDAQTQLMLDWMDHVGMNVETVERYRASRADRREESRAARRAGGRHPR